MRISNLDGRDFIASTQSDTLRDPLPSRVYPAPSRSQSGSNPAKVRKTVDAPSYECPSAVSHYVLNLPDTALEFLDAFRPLMSVGEASDPSARPMIHCHCFTKEETQSAAEADILKVGSIIRTTYLEMTLNRERAATLIWKSTIRPSRIYMSITCARLRL